MPSQRKHKAQIQSNDAFVASASFADGGYRDWYITGCFYVAVHLVDAYLAAQPYVKRQPGNHKGRKEALEELLKRDLIPQDVFDAYYDLYDLSIDSRYRCLAITDEHTRHADELLPPIRAWAMGDG